MSNANDPFTMHGIDHLSPSSLNAYSEAPALWLMERLLKKRSQMGVPAHAGTATETGIVSGLKNLKLDPVECAEIAMKEWRSLTALSTDARKPKYDSAIPRMVAEGLKHLRPYGVPTHTQGKVSVVVEELPIPIIGYFDVYWQNHNILTDIKTSMTMPSQIKLGHAKQVALYKRGVAGNPDTRVTYITPTKSETYALDDHDAHFRALVQVALRLGKFLAISGDPHELAGLVCPNYDSFYWTSNEVRAHGLDVFGF